MTQWGLDNLFNPGKRHMDDEKRRLQSTREEVGDNSGGRRIDLEGGKVSISVQPPAMSRGGTAVAGTARGETPLPASAPDADEGESQDSHLDATDAEAANDTSDKVIAPEVESSSLKTTNVTARDRESTGSHNGARRLSADAWARRG